MRIRITPALVISVIALFIALGGVANATVDLPWNSVGKEQLKWGAVDSSKVANRSLKAIDFAQGQLPQGEQGPKGERGAKGAKGEKGEAGERGPAGAAASGATGGATGLTLKDAAGTVLGTVLGAGNVPDTTWLVLRDGGVFSYDYTGALTTSSSVLFQTSDCTGTAYFYVGTIENVNTPDEIENWQGQKRWVVLVPDSSTAIRAYKATRNVQSASAPAYFISYPGGPCELRQPFDAQTFGLELEQVPAPPVGRGPLSVS